MRRLIAHVVAVWLGGCAAHGPYSEFDPHTGIQRFVSSKTTVYAGYLAKIDIYVVAVAGPANAVFGLKTYVTRSDLNYPKIRSVWSHGQQLRYQKNDRRRFGTARQEAGHIFMSRSDFEEAAHTGIIFEMIGTRASYHVAVPGARFKEIFALLGSDS